MTEEIRMIRNLLLLFIMAGMLSCKPSHINNDELKVRIDHALQTAIDQYKGMILAAKDSSLPRTVENNKLKSVGIYDWTSGFFPASLWYLCQYFNDAVFLNAAKKYTQLLKPLQYVINTHDLGFMVYCPFGNGYKIAGDTSYLSVIENASKSLISRYNPKVGLIKSWDNKEWQYPVIIDNMMNLEMLCETSKFTHNPVFRNIAINHANKTMANHFRPDYSSFHLVNYDTITGGVINKQTVQGYSDGSAWSRGQSWGLYGYTMMFRETGDSAYLDQAVNIAKFLMHNPNMPDDGIPYWDYNAPKIPNEPRDVAAAAIMASALIELSNYAPDKDFLEFAKKIVFNLSSEKYLAQPGTNHNFILMHATGHLPANSEIDVPIIYADYYYIESLLRLKNKLNSSEK